MKRANNNRSKPAWALTEEQKEQLEDEEADDLMDFANNLDVDKYLDDLEVRAALESVRQRIQEIVLKMRAMPKMIMLMLKMIMDRNTKKMNIVEISQKSEKKEGEKDEIDKRVFERPYWNRRRQDAR